MQIDLKISEIKRIIGATNVGPDDSFLVKNISSLENATQEDIAILLDRGDKSVFSPISLEKVKNSNAGFILAQKAIDSEKQYLIVEDPILAFNKIVNFVQKTENQIDNSAVISESATIGQEVFIGAQVYIGKNVSIGDGVKIYPGAKVLDNCIIGDNTIIHSGTIIGSDGFGYSITQKGLQKIPQVGIVKIGQFAEIGANCCIDRAAFDQTVIGNGVKLDNQVHIAHNVIIGDHTAILAQTGIAGGAIIGPCCQIGGQVAIKDHIKIGAGAKIVSKSAVMKDVEEGQVVCGIPAIPFLQWKRISVMLTKLPEYFTVLNKIKTFVEKKENKKPFWRKFF